uniref:RING-type domain-containing protein n=1 Tax=Trichogramma kaykai TaxID=54128 RepID=A0ABD2WYY3_9HYME
MDDQNSSKSFLKKTSDSLVHETSEENLNLMDSPNTIVEVQPTYLFTNLDLVGSTVPESTSDSETIGIAHHTTTNPVMDRGSFPENACAAGPSRLAEEITDYLCNKGNVIDLSTITSARSGRQNSSTQTSVDLPLEWSLSDSSSDEENNINSSEVKIETSPEAQTTQNAEVQNVSSMNLLSFIDDPNASNYSHLNESALGLTVNRQGHTDRSSNRSNAQQSTRPRHSTNFLEGPRFYRMNPVMERLWLNQQRTQETNRSHMRRNLIALHRRQRRNAEQMHLPISNNSTQERRRVLSSFEIPANREELLHSSSSRHGEQTQQQSESSGLLLSDYTELPISRFLSDYHSRFQNFSQITDIMCSMFYKGATKESIEKNTFPYEYKRLTPHKNEKEKNEIEKCTICLSEYEENENVRVIGNFDAHCMNTTIILDNLYIMPGNDTKVVIDTAHTV